ncbi:conserved hypothetical protein [Rhodopseudomonas palustris HaA2]|uniref:DUF2232 domain-containing protein n=1 Tax=Rhodopseudomonas palustris (strain HaA2) TaxID=316058 RepID=Q2IX93_RHOP2|nr:hypothetical protein [Rhodopseudomonas palustris]ABD07167.1 conserved hypothetical protein [Rhodopseudomonas palustris HaA2]
MMIQILIAIAAGCASALMFASIVSGALISLILFYLAPLPLMVAALGWGAVGAAAGGLLGAAGLAAIFSFSYAIAFIVTVVAPAYWLGRLAMLARPAEASDAPPPGALEWYPVGRIVVWLAGFAALTTMAAMLTLGTDGATISEGLRSGLQRALSPRDSADTDKLIDALVAVAPPAAATVAMLTLTLNLWLAAKITATSGRLTRPRPDLRTVALPAMTLAVLSLALGLSFAGGIAGLIGKTVSAALLVAYGLTGAATLHTLTMTARHRGFLLSSTYALVLIFLWPAIGLMALGIGDAAFGFRQRYYQRRSMPPPPTT